MRISSFFSTLKNWGTKIGLGVLDQGLYSGSNFVLNIFLARWFLPESYGAFSASYSLFLLFSILQVALIAEPMSIFGAHKYRKQITTYLNYLLRIQWIGAFLGSLLFFLFSFFIQNSVLHESIIVMGIALPFIFLYWYLRRAFYIETQPALAMVTSLIYSASLLLLIICLHSVNLINSWTAYLAMALSSFAASCLALNRLGLVLLGKETIKADLQQEEMKHELWSFGKWILFAYLAGWLTSSSFPFFITIFLDTRSAGAFRAIQNLFLPFQQLLASITLFALPWLARQKSEYGINKLFSTTHLIAGITGIVSVFYTILVVAFRYKIISFLYDSEFYSSFGGLILVQGISTVLGSAPLVLGLALRVLDKPNAILYSKGYAALFMLLFGLPTILLFQMNGVLFCLIVSSFIEMLLLAFFYYRVKKFRALVEPLST